VNGEVAPFSAIRGTLVELRAFDPQRTSKTVGVIAPATHSLYSIEVSAREGGQGLLVVPGWGER